MPTPAVPESCVPGMETLQTLMVSDNPDIHLSLAALIVWVASSRNSIITDLFTPCSDMTAVPVLRTSQLHNGDAKGSFNNASLWDIQHGVEGRLRCAVAVVEQRIVGAIGYWIAVLP